MGKDP
jgi:hypothetical protein